MQIFLDDEREAPPGWLLVRHPSEIIAALATGTVTAISLDHDLGTIEATGYDVLLWLEEAVACRGFVPPQILIHTANPAARMRMLAAVARIEKFVAQAHPADC